MRNNQGLPFKIIKDKSQDIFNTACVMNQSVLKMREVNVDISSLDYENYIKHKISKYIVEGVSEFRKEAFNTATPYFCNDLATIPTMIYLVQVLKFSLFEGQLGIEEDIVYSMISDGLIGAVGLSLGKSLVEIIMPHVMETPPSNEVQAGVNLLERIGVSNICENLILNLQEIEQIVGGKEGKKVLVLMVMDAVSNRLPREYIKEYAKLVVREIENYEIKW